MSEAHGIRAYSFLHVFANDNTISPGELALIKRLALRDGVVDDDERRVLSAVFGRVGEADVEPDVWADIQQFKRDYEIP